MSKKKNLLNEATVRRFLKLANMEAIGNDFIGEGWGSKAKEYRRGEEGGVEKKAGDVGGHFKDYEVNEEEELDLELGDDVDLEDVIDVEEVPEEFPEEPVGDMEGKVEELVSAIADAIEGVTGVVVDVEGEEEVEVEELPVEDEMEVEVPPEEELEMPEELEEAGVTSAIDTDAIVQEVMKRVAARLLKNRSK